MATSGAKRMSPRPGRPAERNGDEMRLEADRALTDSLSAPARRLRRGRGYAQSYLSLEKQTKSKELITKIFLNQNQTTLGFFLVTLFVNPPHRPSRHFVRGLLGGSAPSSGHAGHGLCYVFLTFRHSA